MSGSASVRFKAKSERVGTPENSGDKAYSIDARTVDTAVYAWQINAHGKQTDLVPICMHVESEQTCKSSKKSVGIWHHK